MTLSPLTIRPVSAVFTVQPTPAAVVGAPGPDVVDDRVVAVDQQAGGGLAGDPAPPIRKNTSWIVVGLAAWLAVEPFGPTCSSTGELVVPASNSRPAIFTPSTSATDIGDDAVVRDERRVAEAEHDGVGPGDVDGLVDVVDARREQQVQALRQRLVDGGRACRPAWPRRTGSAGSTVPGVVPASPGGAGGVGPQRSARTPGSRRPRRRTGTASPGSPGSCASVVYGGFGKLCAGAPCTPRTPCSTRR